MSKPIFFGGLEGFTAKVVSFLLTLTFFSIYAAALKGLTVSWFELSGILLLFWAVYEFLGYILFAFFNFFSRNKFSKYEEENQVEDDTNKDIVTVKEK